MSNENKPTIIVCVDTSSNATTALCYAYQMAKRSDFAVQILVVMEPSRNLLFVSKMVEKESRAQIEKKLNKLTNSVCKTDGEWQVIPTISIREGEAVKEITKEVKSIGNAAMLVLGKSYNYQSDNNVLPKIATQIGKKINIPVVIIPENLSEEAIKRIVG